MIELSSPLAGIKAVIKLLNPSYDANAIFAAYQNNAKYPDDDFIIMTELDSHMNGLTPISAYDAITETQYFGSTDSTWFQVDFYGVGSRSQAAQFRLFLTSYDCSQFLNDGYSCTVHQVQQQMNLTSDLDRGKYKQRHMVKFSLFNNNATSIGSLGFSTDNVDVILAEVQQ